MEPLNKNNISRRSFLQLAFGGAVGLSLMGCNASKPSQTNLCNNTKRKNVLLVISDDLNVDLGCYGNSIVSTPNIDKLAERSVIFDKAYAQYSVCNPSRASFLTGCRPHDIGVMNNFDDFRKLNPDIRTLPQVFRENAYYTASIGKVFHIGPTTPVDLKSWDSCLEWKGTDEMRDTKGKSRNPSNGQLPWCNWKQVEQGKLWDDYITETTIHQLEQNADSPFFIAAGLYKPHDPFCAPKEFFDLYSLEELELPKVPQDASVLPEGITSASVDTIMWNEAYQDMSDNDKLELMQAYYACISYMDSNIGKILDTLKRLKLDDNTIVILIGDHGYHVWEKDWFGKTTVFERSARAPMLISVPDMSSKGKRCERVVEFLDIFPTLTTLCDIEPPASVQGRSLVPLLEEPAKISEDWKGAGYTCFTSDNWSVRTNRWRYIEWNVTYGGKALYDHFKDEGEHYNLVNYPEYAPVVEKLRNMLFSVRGNQGDSGDK